MSDIEDFYTYNNYYSNSDSESDSDIDSDSELIDKYKLQNTWTLYDHIKSDSDSYESNMRKICDINNVIDFWRVFNFYPKPSLIFNNGVCKPKMGDKEISSISMFKKGIEPKWEDPINELGGEISKRKFDRKDIFNELDQNWYTIILACIGEQIDPSITGIRIVDSSNIQKNIDGYKIMFRIELWFDEDGLKNKKDIIENSFKNLLNLDKKLIYFKEHKPRQ